VSRIPRPLVPVVLTGRLFLFEIAAALAALVISAGLAIAAASSLAEASPGGDCIRAFLLAGSLPGCGDAGEFLRRDQSFAAPVTQVFATMPFVFGGFLGAIAISRDLDEGAAPLAWWLYPSRTRWFVERIAILGAVLVLLLLGAAVVSDWLHAARFGYAPDGTFADYGLHGLVLIPRAILAFGVGVLIGAVSGRQLVALITSAAIVIALAVGTGAAVPFGEPFAVVEAPVHQATEGFQLGLDLTNGTQARRGPDGRVVTEEVALADAPAGSYGDRLAWVDARYAIVESYLPPTTMGAVTVREGALELVLAAATIAAGGFIVRRRRPY